MSIHHALPDRLLPVGQGRCAFMVHLRNLRSPCRDNGWQEQP
jgi:hypothetical protein